MIMSERRIIWRLLRRNAKFWICVSLISFVILLAVIGPYLTPYKPNQVLPTRSQPPSLRHPFGIDNLGFDVFTATVYGLRVSLSVGLVAATIATVIGVVLGLLAGYIGGIVDLLIDGGTNLLLTMPTVFILIIIGTFYITGGQQAPGVTRDFYNILLLGTLIGAVSWHWTARAVRSQVSALKVSDFIVTSKLSGNQTLKIVVKDILPNIGSYVLLVFVIQLANALGTAVTLEFLGIKASEWSLFARIQQWLQMGALTTGVWWAWFIPGVLVVILIASLYILVIALEELFNPRLRKV